MVPPLHDYDQEEHLLDNLKFDDALESFLEATVDDEVHAAAPACFDDVPCHSGHYGYFKPRTGATAHFQALLHAPKGIENEQKHDEDVWVGDSPADSSAPPRKQSRIERTRAKNRKAQKMYRQRQKVLTPLCLASKYQAFS